MSGSKRSTKAPATLLLVVFLLATAGAFMALKAKTDTIVREKVPGSSIIYIPSGKFLKYATFGYSALAADLIYLWSIQYYSTPTIDDRFTHLDHIFSIISELDPHYTDPYEVGALIAVQEAHDPEAAFKILDLGLEKNPDQWIFPFDAGHIALMQLKDYPLAEKYFKTCMAIPGAPDFVKRLYANAIYKKGDLKTSWETWLEIYKSALDERTKKIAENHLYNVKATIDIGVVKQALETYRERTGRLPDTLAGLVRAGLLAEVPKDLDGKDYVYDPKTGTVTTVISPWKR
jgi:tetratricopeptide (TPR) repeat protein